MSSSPRATGLLSAAIVFIDSGPGPALGFFLSDASLLVALSNMVGLAFLFICVFGFVATGYEQNSSGMCTSYPSLGFEVPDVCREPPCRVAANRPGYSAQRRHMVSAVIIRAVPIGPN